MAIDFYKQHLDEGIDPYNQGGAGIADFFTSENAKKKKKLILQTRLADRVEQINRDVQTSNNGKAPSTSNLTDKTKQMISDAQTVQKTTPVRSEQSQAEYDFQKKRQAQFSAFVKNGDKPTEVPTASVQSDPTQFVNQFKQTNKNTQTAYVNGVKKLISDTESKAEDQYKKLLDSGKTKEEAQTEVAKLFDSNYYAATNTMDTLKYGGVLKGDFIDFVQASNDRLLGGIGREAIRLGALVAKYSPIGQTVKNITGKDTFSQDNANKFIKNIGLEEQNSISDYGKAGQIAGGVQKGAFDAAQLLIGTGEANALAKGSNFVKNLAEGGNIAKTGLKLAPDYAAIAGKVLPGAAGSAAGTAVGALQDVGNGNEKDILKNAAIGTAFDVVAPVAGKVIGGVTKAIGDNIPNPARLFRNESGEIVEDTADAAFKAGETAAKKKLVPYVSPLDAGFKESVKSADGVAAKAAAGPQYVGNKVSHALNEFFYPTKNLTTEANDVVQAAGSTRRLGQVERTKLINDFTQLAKKNNVPLNMQLIHDFEAGKTNNAFTKEMKTAYDDLRQKGINEAGLDIGYIDNYVQHQYKESDAVVAAAEAKFAKDNGGSVRRAGKNFSATKERKFMTYKDAEAYGLHPKTDNAAVILADYATGMRNAQSGLELSTGLRDIGQVKYGANPPTGWERVRAQGFPKGFQGSEAYAPPEVARVLNSIYGKEQDTLSKVAKWTGGKVSAVQNVVLSGGIPYTPANMFTINQMGKELATGLGELATGHPLQAAKQGSDTIAAFVRGFSKKASNEFRVQNQPLIEEMAKRGVGIKYLNMEEQASKWSRFFGEDKTFGLYMANQQTATAARLYKQLLNKNVPKEEALDQVSRTMKAYFSMSDQLMTGRSEAVQGLIDTVAMAPKYRESVLGVLKNTVQSINPVKKLGGQLGNADYNLNRKLLAGVGMTYALMNGVNTAINGHPMWDNAEGKDLQLAVPYGDKDEDGNQKVMYIPFFPSFLSVPRNVIEGTQALVNGDSEQAKRNFSSLLSIPLQTAGQLSANQDYFGRPIVNTDKEAEASYGKVEPDTAGQKALKYGGYLAGQLLPSAPRGVTDVLLRGQPIEQGAAQAAELPLRFGKLSPASNSQKSYSPTQITGEFYDTKKKLSTQQDLTNTKIRNLLDKSDGSNPEYAKAERLAEEYNKKIEEQFKDFQAQFKNTPAWQKEWDESIEGLKINSDIKSLRTRVKRYATN